MVGADGLEGVELVGGFDAFGDDADADGVGEVGDHLDEGSAAGLVDLVGEGGVDLDGIDGKVLEVGEGGVAGTEVVDGDGHAEGAAGVELGGGGDDLGQQ